VEKIHNDASPLQLPELFCNGFTSNGRAGDNDVAGENAMISSHGRAGRIRYCKALWVFIGTPLLIFMLPALLFANDCSTGGQAGLIHTQRAGTLGKNALNAGIAGQFATGDDYIAGLDGTGGVVDLGNGNTLSATSPQLISGNIFTGYGLSRILDLSFDLPVYYDRPGWGGNRQGFGDLEIAAKLAYPFTTEKAFVLQGYYLNVILPTGNKNRGFFPRHVYDIKNDADNSGIDPFSIDAVFFNPMLLWTFDFRQLSSSVPVQFHVNFGGVIAKQKSSSAVTAAIAAEYDPSASVTLFLELSGESRVKYYTDSFSIGAFDNDPLRCTPGIRCNLPSGFYCIASGDIGIADSWRGYRARWTTGGYGYSTKSTPAWSAQLCIGWSNPPAKESKEPVETAIVQPPKPLPVVAVKNDTTPKAPSIENFPEKVVVKDHDNDGVPDSLDRCPDEAGTAANGGCPEPHPVIVKRDTMVAPPPVLRRPLVLGAIHFETGESGLSYGSKSILDEVALSLNEWSEVKIEIQGYSDAVGNEATNTRLSQLRAQSVLAYLVSRGISSERLRAVGLGSANPLDSNNSAAGRKKNRRVELHRVDY
jgi:outer membrane protein OmpA-like peptidoglycan-associated protein